ncbi:MAG: hypothetical protein GY835_05085 [bacterium]|nr:hypothetical protein [bacterium]
MPKNNKKLDVNSMLKSNPQVDSNQFHEALEVLHELEKQGVEAQGFNLISPYSGTLEVFCAEEEN